jgi:dihydroorotate dehydrogenase (fumarate)
MDLSTTYMGFRLAHPLMPGASPLVDDLDMVKRLEDAGAAAIVMHSLFEEQIKSEEMSAIHRRLAHEESHAEALSYFPRLDDYSLGPERYLEQVRRIKLAVGIPVIASLNGTTPEGWLQYGHWLEQAGADALELNFYHVATNPDELGLQVDLRVLDVARTVKRQVGIPVAVKLSPFFSSLPYLARQLDHLGVDGLVLFNRFYQPDIDPEALETVPRLHLSDPAELLLRLRWLAILHGAVGASLAATGGVHTHLDAVKAIMAGASAVQVVTALLRHGPQHLTAMRDELARWLEDHQYESLQQMLGSMSLRRCPNPEAFERGNYLKVLQTWPIVGRQVAGLAGPDVPM